MKWKKFLAGLLIWVITITALPQLATNSFAATTQEVKIGSSNGYEILFKVNSQWETGFEAQFIL